MLVLLSLLSSVFSYSSSHNDGKREEWRQQRGGWWSEAGRGCWVTSRRGRKLLLQDRGAEGIEWASAIDEGGLPDWMGPAMSWWSMGQVLGFSHCRKFIFLCVLWTLTLWILNYSSPLLRSALPTSASSYVLAQPLLLSPAFPLDYQ